MMYILITYIYIYKCLEILKVWLKTSYFKMSRTFRFFLIFEIVFYCNLSKIIPLNSQ